MSKVLIMPPLDTLIITPTLGNRETLLRTVESVRNIGCGRVKHILVTPLSMKEILQEKFPDLDIIIEPFNCTGIYQALNFALKPLANKFQYIGYLNDDDYWLPSFKKNFSILDTNKNIDGVYGRVNYINEYGDIIGEQTSSYRYKSFSLLLKSNIVLFTQQATLIRADLFFKVGGFDESYKLIADTKFWLTAIGLGSNFQYTNTICASYTYQANQLTSDKKLLEKEHNILLNEIHRSNIFNEKLEMFLFRLMNLRIYYRRFLNRSKNREKLKYR